MSLAKWRLGAAHGWADPEGDRMRSVEILRRAIQVEDQSRAAANPHPNPPPEYQGREQCDHARSAVADPHAAGNQATRMKLESGANAWDGRVLEDTYAGL